MTKSRQSGYGLDEDPQQDETLVVEFQWRVRSPGPETGLWEETSVPLSSQGDSVRDERGGANLKVTSSKMSKTRERNSLNGWRRNPLGTRLWRRK